MDISYVKKMDQVYQRVGVSPSLRFNFKIDLFIFIDNIY